MPDQENTFVLKSIENDDRGVRRYGIDDCSIDSSPKQTQSFIYIMCLFLTLVGLLSTS